MVSAPQSPEAEDVLRNKAAACGSPLTFVDHPYSGDIGLEGPHQKWNASLAVAAVRAAGFNPADPAISDGLRDVSWSARFQQIGDRIILDGAHNPHAASALVRTWREKFGPQKTAVVFGAMKDKDYRKMLEILSGIAASFHFVPVISPRSADPEELSRCTTFPSRSHRSLGAAIDAAMSETPLVLITGSLFLAGEAFDVITAGIQADK